jgi:hypothetical protein
MEFVPLIYYSLGITIITALHTEYHRRHWPKCRACRSHSYLLSIITGIITFSIGIISLSFIITYINKIPHPYFWIILIDIPRSSAAVGTSYDQCNLSSLRHEIPHSSAVGSFIWFLLAIV